MRPRAPGLVAVLAAAAVAGCGTDPQPEPQPGGSPTRSGVTGEVVVLAAASLQETFTAVAEDVEADHPGLAVTLSFGASSELAQQVLAGAPADVLATASPAPMRQVVDAGAVAGPPTVFARNAVTIAVPTGNPGGVEGLADLADPDVSVALCQPQVPCGAVAAAVLEGAGVRVQPVSLEEDVRATLTRVRLGEVDAGMVYATDVRAAAGEVEEVALPPGTAATTDYPVAVLAEAPDPAAAEAFVAAVLADGGQRVLADAGFSPPP